MPDRMWGVYQAGQPHVIPQWESDAHYLTLDCWCGPVLDDGVVVHNDRLGAKLGLHPKRTEPDPR